MLLCTYWVGISIYGSRYQHILRLRVHTKHMRWSLFQNKSFSFDNVFGWTGFAMNRTCAMIKPDAICNAGKILECITRNGLLIKHMRMCQLSRKQAEEFYNVHQGKPFYEWDPILVPNIISWLQQTLKPPVLLITSPATATILSLRRQLNLIFTWQKSSRVDRIHRSIELYCGFDWVKSFDRSLIQLISNGPVIAMELVGENALCRWRLLLGEP